jgi:riboflavin synthase
MFTGIIETTAKVVKLDKDGTNLDVWFDCEVSDELKIDQSVAHNGVCLTVVDIKGSTYKVTAIEETLIKTNMNALGIGSDVNLERCLKANGRYDGHIVQGHVDTQAKVIGIDERDGSWNFMFELEENPTSLIVEKGSICINGVSLTVVSINERKFSVSIIPYTYEHTNFRSLFVGDFVNIEYDILGKYIAAALNQRS